MSHTPGPWKKLGEHEHIDEDTGMGFRFALVGSEPSAVAWVADDEGDDEGPDNVALIMAAPELLKLCKSAVAELEGLYRKGVRVNPYLTEDLRSAILKATGIKEAQ